MVDFLQLAIRRNNIDEVRELLDRGLARVDHTVRLHSNQPLHQAAYTGSLEIVRLLLEREADVNAVNKHKNTPLYLAALKNHCDLVRELLRARASLDVRCQDTCTPLDVACHRGHCDVVRCLLDANASLERLPHEPYPLHLAAAAGNVAVIELLLSHRQQARHSTTEAATQAIDLEWRDRAGLTALMHASKARKIAAVRELLDARADVNAKSDASGNTALTLAAWDGALEIVRLLLAHRAHVGARVTSLRSRPTALALACMKQHSGIVHELVCHIFSHNNPEGEADVIARCDRSKLVLREASRLAQPWSFATHIHRPLPFVAQVKTLLLIYSTHADLENLDTLTASSPTLTSLSLLPRELVWLIIEQVAWIDHARWAFMTLSVADLLTKPEPSSAPYTRTTATTATPSTTTTSTSTTTTTT